MYNPGEQTLPAVQDASHRWHSHIPVLMVIHRAGVLSGSPTATNAMVSLEVAIVWV